MKTGTMTNEQVTALMKAAQAVWKKYRDDPPGFYDLDAWDEVIREANAPLEGLPEHAAKIMLFFVHELHERSKSREKQNR